MIKCAYNGFSEEKLFLHFGKAKMKIKLKRKRFAADFSLGFALGLVIVGALLLVFLAQM